MQVGNSKSRAPLVLFILVLLTHLQVGSGHRAESSISSARYSQILASQSSKEMELGFYRELLGSYQSKAIQSLNKAERSLREKKTNEAASLLNRAAVAVLNLSNEGGPSIVALRVAAAGRVWW